MCYIQAFPNPCVPPVADAPPQTPNPPQLQERILLAEKGGQEAWRQAYFMPGQSDTGGGGAGRGGRGLFLPVLGLRPAPGWPSGVWGLARRPPTPGAFPACGPPHPISQRPHCPRPLRPHPRHHLLAQLAGPVSADRALPACVPRAPFPAANPAPRAARPARRRLLTIATPHPPDQKLWPRPARPPQNAGGPPPPNDPPRGAGPVQPAHAGGGVGGGFVCGGWARWRSWEGCWSGVG
jgi:hypothetical protein